MRSFFMGDERGAVSADHVAFASGLVVLGILGLYKVASWADVVLDEVGEQSSEYAAYSPPGVADVTEADFSRSGD